ncbi:MAG TPA: hypothetical protein ENI05_15785 [Porticoccus sp.]|nr:hypothetical protein [Porticoccus sp.]
MKLWKLVIVCLCLAGVVAFWPPTESAQGRTLIENLQTLTLSAVDATPLDGTSASRTFLASDRLDIYTIFLTEGADAVEVIGYSTGSDTADDTALINIYGYSRTGPAFKILDATTFTLGTAVAPDSGLYAGVASGTDLHSTTVGTADSIDNGIVKVSFDTVGLKYLYFEPETFTGITNFIIQVRQYGFLER